MIRVNLSLIRRLKHRDPWTRMDNEGGKKKYLGVMHKNDRFVVEARVLTYRLRDETERDAALSHKKENQKN